MFIHRRVPGIVVAAALLIAPAPAFAQGAGVKAGVKAGVNFASLTPEEDDEGPYLSRRSGLVAGGWVRAPLTSRCSLQIEGLFSEKGVRFDPRALGLGLDGDVDVRIRYVETPVLVRATRGAAGSTARVFVVGGAAACRLSARDRVSFQGEESTFDRVKTWKPLDLGLAGGLGAEVGRASIEARYTHGPLHINEDDNGDGDRIKNRVFGLTLGVRLR